MFGNFHTAPILGDDPIWHIFFNHQLADFTQVLGYVIYEELFVWNAFLDGKK